MNKSWIYLFWGAVDLVYVVRFCHASFSAGRIPLLSDILSIGPLLEDHGFVVVVFVWLGIILHLSIIMSMILFFRCSTKAPWLAYAQTSFRLMLVVPSLPITLLFVPGSGVVSAVLMFGLLILSEFLKVVSIYFSERRLSD